MPSSHSAFLDRISINPDARFGKACIRGHRITVEEILECSRLGLPRSNSWRIILSSNTRIFPLFMRMPLSSPDVRPPKSEAPF
jgi:hypothetical protein